MSENAQESLLDGMEQPKMPSGLNVLTILTFIGSGFAIISLPLMKWAMSFGMKAMEKNPEMMDKMSAKELEDFNKGKAAMDLINANYTILLAVIVLGAILCIYGAIRMRKLKKEGFYIYLAGQVFPVIAATFIMGFANQFNGIGSYIMNIGIPALFIFLYARYLSKMS